MMVDDGVVRSINVRVCLYLHGTVFERGITRAHG